VTILVALSSTGSVLVASVVAARREDKRAQRQQAREQANEWTEA